MHLCRFLYSYCETGPFKYPIKTSSDFYIWGEKSRGETSKKWSANLEYGHPVRCFLEYGHPVVRARPVTRSSGPVRDHPGLCFLEFLKLGPPLQGHDP